MQRPIRRARMSSADDSPQPPVPDPETSADFLLRAETTARENDHEGKARLRDGTSTGTTLSRPDAAGATGGVGAFTAGYPQTPPYE